MPEKTAVPAMTHVVPNTESDHDFRLFGEHCIGFAIAPEGTYIRTASNKVYRVTLHRDDMVVPQDLFTGNLAHLRHLETVLHTDKSALYENDVNYDASWKKRGGHSAFENLCRKWDRLYARVKRYGWDIFEAIAKDQRREGVIDDVRDLRRYLALVECEMIERRTVEPQLQTKDSLT